MNRRIKESRIYWPIIILFLAFGIDIILNIFLANILDAEQYGDYAVAIKVAELFAIFCLMGSSASVTRFIPSYFKDKNWSKFKGFYKNRMKIFFILCFFIIIILIIIFAVLWLLNSNESIDIFFNHHPLLLAIFLIPFIGLAIILSRTLDSIKHQYIAAITNRLAMPLLLLTLTFLFTIFFEKITSVDIIFMFFIILILIITFQLLVIYAKLPSNFYKIQPKFESELWQKTSTQLLVSSLIFFAFNQTGLIMLEIMHTNESNVGIFAAILTITSIIWLIRAGALYIYNPMIAPLFEKKQFDELQKIARQSAKNIRHLSK